MTFNDYLDHLNALAKKHPDLLEMRVIASADTEGNHYHGVAFTPEFGKLSSGTDFYPYDRKTCKKKDINALCIN
ncbi:hypothetical protein [uncultured Dokdonia sp.]|uniref:hypothetical protein n=1 Tax=uncultured Dokdonia sp. TaxID=575653 RepID=UPI0026141F8F|nr:hypothetical protein [uncultured Dokdonia sp.]